MKGDALLGEARRNGQTSAASKLRNKKPNCTNSTKKKEVISQQNEKSKNSTRKVITTTNSKGLWVFTKQD